MYDIQAAREILRAFSLTIEHGMFNVKDSTLIKTIIKMPEFEANGKLVYEWYVQQGLMDC